MSQPKPLELTIRLVRHRRLLFVGTCLLWALIHVLPVLYGVFVKALFDALSGAGAAGQSAWSYLALALAVDVARLGLLGGGIVAWCTYWIETTLLLRRNLLDHLLNAPGSRRLPDSPGEAISRFRDDVNDIAEYVESWVDFWGLAAFAAFALVVMMAIDPLMTTLVCVPLLLTFFLTGLLRPRIRRVRKAMRESTGRVTDFIGEMTGGVQALKVAGAEGSALAHFDALNSRRRKAALEDTLITEIFRSVTDNMVNIATGIILLLAAGALKEGSFSVGDFALFVAYLPRLTGVMSFIGAMLVQHKRTGIAFERLERLMQDAESSVAVADLDLHLSGPLPAYVDVRPEPLPLRKLTVDRLSYRHPDGALGIDEVSFELERGAFTVVTGPVGSGKSTLIRALLGLLPATSGTVSWNGVKVEDPATFFVPPRSAYTPQVPRLFSDSLRENLLLGSTSDPLAVEEALNLAVLREDVARLERGLDTPVGSRGVKLSGGQVQRSAAARMFLRDADLLVFDDLSSALDVQTEALLWERLGQRGEVTCLVVSHRPAALARADRILLMDGGRLVEQGALADLLAGSALFLSLLHRSDESREVGETLSQTAV
ncbi:MAG TPA: ABC transporter ATP-binding protein [Trueperaceae bacterium]